MLYYTMFYYTILYYFGLLLQMFLAKFEVLSNSVPRAPGAVWKDPLLSKMPHGAATAGAQDRRGEIINWMPGPLRVATEMLRHGLELNQRT